MTYDAVLIAGPTASGKSAAALDLAEQIGGTIINADSMQVYAEVQVLTARPTPAQTARVPHLLYGHVSVRAASSAGRYAVDAAAALAETRGNGRVPIFVGGSGLYFTALTDGLARIPPTPPQIRDRARALLDEIGVAALHARLAARDPASAACLRPPDPQRVLRAFEVLEATGKPLVYWQRLSGAPVLKDLRLARFVLDPPRALLRARIAARFDAMMQAGALREALALKNLDPALPAARLLGLRPLIALAEGRIDEQAARCEAITATRQFAKRQMTWFRHRMADYNWLDVVKSNIVADMRRIYDGNCLTTGK
jgi:tRNA dimethylallyltransferase